MTTEVLCLRVLRRVFGVDAEPINGCPHWFSITVRTDADRYTVWLLITKDFQFRVTEQAILSASRTWRRSAKYSATLTFCCEPLQVVS